MVANPPDEPNLGDRWDQLLVTLAADPRREIIRSLLSAPRESRLPLPQTAETANQSVDSETLILQLRHQHLPKLANAGFICWTDDPFCVQRGPNFEESAFLIEAILESIDQIPLSLVNNCETIQGMKNGG